MTPQNLVSEVAVPTTLPIRSIGRLTFRHPLNALDLPAFRGAIIEKVGLQADLWHNHSTGTAFIHRYPRIQYQLHEGHAGIWAIAEGTEALGKFWADYDGELALHHKTQRIEIGEFVQSKAAIGPITGMRDYQLNDWMPLTTESLAEWDAARGLSAKAALIQRILRNQLVGFLQQLDMAPAVQVEAVVTDIVREKSLSYRGIRFKALNINFQTNLTLPSGMGLGKAASEGFGRLREAY